MTRASKDAWLTGPSDLRTAEVEDVPVKGQTVLVRGLPAAYSNEAQSEALELINTPSGDQKATINSAKMEVLQFAHGVIEPQFSLEEAEQIAQRFGPAFKKVIQKIDELSGVDKEAVDRATALFPAGGEGEGDRGEAGADPVPAGGS